MIENGYTVSGMSCAHCAQSVTEELTELPGVEDVHVDVETGHVKVRSTEPLTEEAVKLAVEEAGYTYEGAAVEAA
ncbi:heavy-metal-associated domain-containing protein [Amycolatopsis sp. FDAARGOS 1241]|uniref:heavy-metal-associated domain-containing protein n=1 Tax=Amycolatopsis sp. FDAARGOS 1241 TaxID=2778070 RepID=UPI00194E2932|nr:heavy-metal-associated domain-containing protein [Amycolatopsis sp. FDAARGOS 1241]QRP45629.1 heavy-metal-associated domain-containing protein [Amycolatopsis sp. FDAARGOS 1241]